MRLLFGHDAEVAHWVCERIPHLRVRIPYYEVGQALGPSRAIGVLNEAGDLVAGVIYHAYDPFVRSMELSCAATSLVWAKPDIVSTLLRFPFQSAQCIRISAITPRGGTRARRFLEGLGFKREGSARRAFGTENAIIYGLLAEEWAQHRFNLPSGALSGGEEVGTSSAAAA